MKIPFTQEQFLQVFQQYNQNIWPMQLILTLLAVTALGLLFFNKEGLPAESSAKARLCSRISSAILGLLWIWSGLVYHLLNFASINPPAKIFGIVFILQGVLFFLLGTLKVSLRFEYTGSAANRIGLILIGYGLICYPVLGTLLGHGYPHLPTFGAPCPLTIFTFGMLLLTCVERFPIFLLIIPGLWTLVGSNAAISFGIWEDLGLLVSGMVSITLLVMRQRQQGCPFLCRMRDGGVRS